MTQSPLYILILCTGNSARSILAEALFNKYGKKRFRAYSAGSHPVGKVNSLVIDLLKSMDYRVDDLRSKSWDEFAQPDAPVFDAVITLCDNAAGEVCPVWPGNPVTAHWGMEDPASAQGRYHEKLIVFEKVYRELEHRIERLVRLPADKLSPTNLKASLEEIAK